MQIKKNQERVLAYKQAKIININELEKVSGGEKAFTCQRPSGHVSGSPGYWDGSIDVVIDGHGL